MQVPYIFNLTVSFKILNFGFQIGLLFVLEMSASFTSYICFILFLIHECSLQFNAKMKLDHNSIVYFQCLSVHKHSLMHVFRRSDIKSDSQHPLFVVLYLFSDNGQPKQVVKTIWPTFNTLVFFEVMCKSFHQVSMLRQYITIYSIYLLVQYWFQKLILCLVQFSLFIIIPRNPYTGEIQWIQEQSSK